MKVNFKIVRSWSGINPDGEGFWCFVGDVVDIKLHNTNMLPPSIRMDYTNKPVRIKIINIAENQIKGFLIVNEEDKSKNFKVMIKPDDVAWIKVIQYVDRNTKQLV